MIKFNKHFLIKFVKSKLYSNKQQWPHRKIPYAIWWLKIQISKSYRTSIPSKPKASSQSQNFPSLLRSYTQMNWTKLQLMFKFSHSKSWRDGLETSRRTSSNQLYSRWGLFLPLRMISFCPLYASNFKCNFSCSNQTFEIIRQKNELNLHFNDFPNTLIKLLKDSGTNNSAKYLIK